MKLISKLSVAFAAAACLTVAATAPARAQVESREGIALQNQILELRHDLQQMQSQQGSQGGSNNYRAPPPDNAQPAGSSDINA